MTFPLDIKTSDDPIKRLKASKSLGVHIDEHLTWSNHVDQLAKKIPSVLAGLKFKFSQRKEKLSSCDRVLRNLKVGHFTWCSAEYDK